MIIILEGPDGSGKTTLGRSLAKRMNARYIHATYKFPKKMFTYQTALMHEAMRAVAAGQPVIMDRLWISEAIYAKVFRDGSPWPLMGRYFERLLYKVGGFYIYCRPPENYREYYTRLKGSRVEMYDNVDKVVRVANMYERYMGKRRRLVGRPPAGYLFSASFNASNKYNAITYSIEDDGRYMDAYVNRVATKAQIDKGRYPFMDDENLTGNFHGRILLIGDELAPSRKGKLGWPFHAYENCSLYLTETLHVVGFQECDLCYTNINEDGGVRNVGAWIGRHYYGPHVTIIMGRNAERTYLEHFSDQPYLYLPHPQAARRFPRYGEQFTEKLTNLYKGKFYQGLLS